MKKLLVGLLVLGSISSFAGTIIAKKTGRKILFSINEQASKQFLTIDATYAGGNIITLELGNANEFVKKVRKKSNEQFAPIFMASRSYYDGGASGGGEIIFFFPFDLISLPITATLEITHKNILNKDIRKINKAIFTDNMLKVSEKRLDRIMDLLKL
ncbi:MAG: hypothetical protein N4A33_08480 [Bacteriovoracaceae bacterium]|jgi:hypothetical protein|nr:hypothetical protein [Bacteriovoracaceae bacterium]